MFPGKDLEELNLAFTIVDYVYDLRKKVFKEYVINDRSDEASVVIPNYDKMATIMRCDIRSAEYFKNPYNEKSLESIDGQELHSDLNDIFKMSQERRKADILNAYRFIDFTQAYNPRSKIHVLADDVTTRKTEKDIQDEILILIHMLGDDPDAEIVLRDIFDNVKSNGRETLENFLELLVAKDYQTIYATYK